MVRPKSTPTSTSHTKMVNKCFKCDLAMNRQGEKRPGICCKECKREHCNKCAGLAAELCEMMRAVEKGIWTCHECETKNADIKAVLDSMKSELHTIRDGQAEQQAERVQVLEGLKAVEAVVKKLDRIEAVQENQEEKLLKHEDDISKNTRKGEEGESRLKKLEERMEQIDQNAIDMRQFNEVVREVRDIEKKERNVVIFNVPESNETEAEERKKADMKKVGDILKELNLEDIRPINVIRVGNKGGRYPQQILTILRTVEDCEKIMKKCRNGPRLPNDSFITRDRTFRQRQEAKLFRLEKEKEERGDVTQPGGKGGVRGRRPGRPRGRGGAGRGGGGRGGPASERRRRRQRKRGRHQGSETLVTMKTTLMKPRS